MQHRRRPDIFYYLGLRRKRLIPFEHAGLTLIAYGPVIVCCLLLFRPGQAPRQGWATRQDTQEAGITTGVWGTKPQAIFFCLLINRRGLIGFGGRFEK